ncbi:hypothetical protein [Endozoicomonas sp. SESOKO1]|uniref:hypothetical protein n=1 Tax=Endozoicomonas sp. SESOKO1 TaxID=2828742 RepID=UPI0021479231|nr:hypothetical protein [Endozoicomonas sp. SESOKO1]
MEEKYQFDASEQPTTYQGISVQTLDTAFPIYPKQPDMDKNNANSFNSLNDYGIEPVTLSNTAGFFSIDIPDIPTSVLDEYIPDIPLIQQICLSGSEPEISEPTPASHSIPDCSLTHLPDVLPNPQDLRPFTAVNPLNQNQTTSDKQTPQAKEIVDNSAKTDFRRKRRREPYYHNNPDFAEREKKRNRERYQNDPVYLERKRARQKEYYKERYQNNPDFAERIRNRRRKKKREPDKGSAVENGCAVHV